MTSLQTRISIGTGLAVISAVAILSGVAARREYRSGAENASAQALEAAKLQAMTVKGEIEVALDSARNMASMLAAVKRQSASQLLTREQVISMLEEVARRNPNFLGVYTAWEPNAFDGQDAKYSGQKGHDQTGRFLPYLVHGQNGEVGLEPLADLENQERGATGVRKGEYYLCPKETGTECVLNPYLYEVQGKQVLMTSTIVPIMADGRFQGIAGVDIAVDTLQKRLDEANLGGLADRIAIISESGRLIAARGRKDLDGQPAAEYSPALSEQVLKGNGGVIRAGNDLLALAPASFGQARQTWEFAVLVPYAKATAGAWALVVQQVLIGLAIAAIAVALVVLLLARPIKRALEVSVHTLRQSSAQVAVSAREIAGSSRSLAQGSSEQAASLEETSASTAEINAMAARNATDANAASTLVEKSQAAIEETHQKLGEMVDSISAIAESSNKISKIISAIDGIAFQTNILALNAAVEAARAGDAGMGFAVVADEVRNLAQRSAQSARETAVLIEESIERAKEGRSKVESVVQSVHAFTSHSAEVKRLVEGMATGSQEQARGVDQISRAIHDMERETQRVAAGAEEFSAATREIEEQVSGVERVVVQLEEMVEGGRNGR